MKVLRRTSRKHNAAIHLIQKVGDNTLALCQVGKQRYWPYEGARLSNGGEWIVVDVPDDTQICQNCRRAANPKPAPPPKPPRKTAAEKRREEDLARLARWTGRC